MKKIFTFIFFAFFFIIKAQVVIEPSSLELTTNENNKHAFNIVISNKGNTDLDVYWTITKGSDWPVAWKTVMCDTEFCYDENFDKIDIRRPNKLKAKADASFKLDLDLGGKKGVSNMFLRLYSDKEFKNLLSTTKVNAPIIADATVSTSDLKGTEDLSIYPNPADNFYFIKSDQGILKVTLFNVLGREIKTESHYRSQTHDISDLNKGVYFLRMQDANNKVVKTIRLTKR
jgi:hypothetical protein